MIFGVIWVWFLSEWFGAILLRSGYVWIGLFLVWFGVFWSGLLSFVYFFCGNQSFFWVWFGCGLFLNDLVSYYWGQFMSELVWFWCGLVSYGAVWCDFYIFKFQWMFFGCDFGVICFWMIWSDIIEVRLGQNWFVFGVIWCLMMCLCNFLQF